MSIIEYFFIKRTELKVVGTSLMQVPATYDFVIEVGNWMQETYSNFLY